MSEAPLILTLWMDEAAQARFQALRDAHFPPSRNIVPAHVTLFHALPGQEMAAVVTGLRAACADVAPVELRVTAPRFLGRGVAYGLEGPALPALRARLAAAWGGWLTAQDRQGWRPHVTVQNKVPAELARATHAALAAAFQPWSLRAEGLRLWRYLGGPWEPAGDFPFLRPAAALSAA